MKAFKLLAALSVSVLSYGCSEPTSPPDSVIAIPAPQTIAKVDSYVSDVVRLNEVPGLALAVIKDGKIIHENYYGVAELNTQEPVTRDTVFRLYSTSKLLTAVAIHELVEQGKISLDDPISNYFDDLPESWHDVTIAHLLSHSSGLPDLPRDEIDKFADDTLPDTDFWKWLYSLERQFPTGQGWQYNQTNYLLLERLLEQETGERFEDYLRAQALSHVMPERIIFSSDDNETIPKRARNYKFNVETGKFDRKLENWGTRNNVLAGLNLTLPELTQWSRNLAAGKLVSGETKARMWTPLNDDPDAHFAIGWGIYPVAKEKSYGFTGGGVTGVRHFPDHDMSIIVLTNGHKYFSVHNTVINHVAGLIEPILEYKHVALARMYQHEFLETRKLDVSALYDRTIKNRPDLDAAEVMESFGYKLSDIREPELAIEVYTEITNRNPKSVNAYKTLGYAQLGHGQMNEALTSFETALKLEPDNAEIQKLIKGLRERL